MLKDFVKRLCLLGLDRVRQSEQESARFHWMNERPLEAAFALSELARISPKTVLDVGSGQGPWPAMLKECGFLVTAIDEQKGYWSKRIINSYFHVLHDDITKPSIKGKFGAVTCISVIEHIQEHLLAVKEMAGLLEPGGELVITCPYSENNFQEDVYKHPEAGYGKGFPYICRVYSRNEIEQWVSGAGGEITSQKYFRVFSGDLWTMGERLKNPQEVDVASLHHLSAISIRV